MRIDGSADFKFEDVEQSMSARFEEIVRRHPGRLAVKMGESALTYEQLNHAANRIAHAILNLAGAAKEPIGLLFEQGIDVIAAILGVLKSGKFYIALDPSSPPERMRHILQDSGATVLLTNNQNANFSGMLLTANLTVLSVEKIERALPTSNPEVPISPDDTASICYTSGSTGQPKGVIETHRFRLYNVLIHSHNVPIRTDDRVSLLHSVAFATAQTNLARALLHGASLLPFDVKSKGLPHLVRWLKDEGITICHMPVGAFRQFAEFLSPEDEFPLLRIIHLSGAPIHRSDFDLYKKKLPRQTAFAFHLGMTESGPICAAVVDRTFDFPSAGVPAGYPLAGRTISLVDDDGRKVSGDEVGEIAVASRYLAKGYWKQPELTKLKFLPDPNDLEGRLYLTGDMGRFMPDGLLVHLGRKDLQIKIRGFRVELGEVERALLAHPGVREVGVAAWDRNGAEKSLLAYVVKCSDSEIFIDDLREFLRTKLPDYMIPTSFVFMPSLPHTNGKLDRRALPKPDDKRPELGIAYAPARNDVERKLLRIWEEVLGLRTIGIYDRFFDLGGNSLLAIKLFGQIEKAFGKPLVPAVLFEFPTVAGLAEGLIQDRCDASLPSLLSVQPAGSKPPLFWIHGDSSYSDLPAYLAQDQPLFGLDHQSQDGESCRYASVETIATHYLGQIRKVQTRGPYWLGGYSFGGTIAFEIAQQLIRQGDKVGLLFMLDSSFPGVVPASGSDSSNSPDESIGISLFRQEVKDRWQILRQLSLAEKVAFIAARVWARANSSLYPIRKFLKLLTCQTCVATGRPIPRSLRSFYILNVYDQARREYRPQLFAGRVIYCKSSLRSNEHRRNWEKLMRKGLETFEVPGDHTDLIRPPAIGMWAKKLHAYLCETQALCQIERGVSRRELQRPYDSPSRSAGRRAE
jgi:amino acid adenylation domain-containing protein